MMDVINQIIDAMFPTPESALFFALICAPVVIVIAQAFAKPLRRKETDSKDKDASA